MVVINDHQKDLQLHQYLSLTNARFEKGVSHGTRGNIGSRHWRYAGGL